MVSLFEIYNNRKGQFPKHHYMDLETINWIEENKPTFNINISTKRSIKPEIDKILLEIKKFTPLSNWFLNPEEENTIHGMRHILRVTFFSLVLVSLKDYDKECPNIFQNVLVASALHDLRRRNDLVDLYHSKRTARWFKENISSVENHYEIHLSEGDIDEIYQAILLHNKPYKDIFDNPEYIKYKTLTDILKTADALDRYRLPNVSFWINDKHLSLIPTDNLKQIAFELLILSELNFLNGSSNVDSILIALNELKH